MVMIFFIKIIISRVIVLWLINERININSYRIFPGLSKYDFPHI